MLVEYGLGFLMSSRFVRAQWGTLYTMAGWFVKQENPEKRKRAAWRECGICDSTAEKLLTE